VAWVWTAVAGQDPAAAPLGFVSGSWGAPEAGMVAALVAVGVLPPDATTLHGPEEPMTAVQWDGVLLRLQEVGVSVVQGRASRLMREP